jgi:DNA polymerase-3 subunit gamma/tau
MENFIVSARKYRPTTFDSVVGQAHITTTLKNAIKSNHLAQAFLFCGPRGVGKTTCARILAKTINCENLNQEGEACGKCASCYSFQENTSLTIHELDAASNNSVDDIRNLIDQVRYPPQSGRYKIYIIDEVHMLSPAAFNAFLKTLEEPPSYAIFILATTEKHKIIPTILSRCQIFDFNRIQWKDMAQHLANIAEKENIAAEPAALELISIKADGGLRDALSMFDLNVTFSIDNSLRHKDVLENLHILDSDYYFTLTDHLVSQNHTETLLLVDEIMRKGFDGHQFISGLMEHFRNLLFAKDPKTLALMELSDESRQKFVIQSEKTQTSFLLSSMSICSQCEIHYKSAKNPRLHLELSLLKINYLPSLFRPNNQVATEGAPGKKSESPVGTKGTSNHETSVPNTTVLAKDEIVINTPSKPESEPISQIQEGAPIKISVLSEEITEPTMRSKDIDLSTSMSEQTATHVATNPEIESAITKSPISTSGLRSAKNIIDSKNDAGEKNAQSEDHTDKEVREITLEELQSEWTQMANNFKSANLINKYVMMNRPIHVIGNTIHISFENEVQMQQFNENIRLELLTTLRNKLKNHLIDIELNSVEPEKNDKKKLYTQSDKYNFLVEKHPVISELKQRFGLDHEF